MDADQLHDAVAEKSGLPREHVDQILCALQETVRHAVQANEDVYLPGFGTWNRSTTSSAFDWTVKIVPSPEDLGIDYKNCAYTDQNILSIAEYLRKESHAFAVGDDPFPTTVPASHPGAITQEELDDEIEMVNSRRIDMRALGDQIVRNFRGN